MRFFHCPVLVLIYFVAQVCVCSCVSLTARVNQFSCLRYMLWCSFRGPVGGDGPCLDFCSSRERLVCTQLVLPDTHALNLVRPVRSIDRANRWSASSVFPARLARTEFGSSCAIDQLRVVHLLIYHRRPTGVSFVDAPTRPFLSVTLPYVTSPTMLIMVLPLASTLSWFLP